MGGCQRDQQQRPVCSVASHTATTKASDNNIRLIKLQCDHLKGRLIFKASRFESLPSFISMMKIWDVVKRVKNKNYALFKRPLKQCVDFS